MTVREGREGISPVRPIQPVGHSFARSPIQQVASGPSTGIRAASPGTMIARPVSASVTDTRTPSTVPRSSLTGMDSRLVTAMLMVMFFLRCGVVSVGILTILVPK